MADLTWGNPPQFSARELTDIREDHKPQDQRLYPTAEQTAIIEAGPDPLLVVAGAGSGKTHTMTDRVIWLIANGYVRPEEVLGVTFTRKAASELETRINHAIDHLANHPKIDLGLEADEIGQATVTTYHSYANTLVAEHGLRIGVETEATLMGPAQAHQLLTDVVKDHDIELDLSDVTNEDLANGISDFIRRRPLSSTIKAVKQLAGDCAEHLIEPEDVKAALAEMFQFGLGLPGLNKVTRNITQIFTSLKLRSILADMVADYLTRKKTENVMDYGDLVRYAAQIARRIPDVRELERQKYKIVLLDEFQDTSHAQLQLFAHLFGRGDGSQTSHSVTAVGDPNQSIYGFRGASAGQLFSFVDAFGAQQLELTTAWRNASQILDVANHIAQPLRDNADAGQIIPELQARPAAPTGVVELNWFASTDDEAQLLVDRIQQLPDTETIAVLCRTKKQFAPIIEVLQARSIPYELVGLSGLLGVPEITEMVSVLKMLGDPQDSNAVIRVLTNARWRIGPEDLVVLNSWASSNERSRRVDPLATQQSAQEDIDTSSLVAALLRLPAADWTNDAGQTFSTNGYQRLQHLATELRDLMEKIHLPLPTLIRHIEKMTGVGIEVGVRPGVHNTDARQYLNEFLRIAENFQPASEEVNSLDLLSFLTWLEIAEEEEDGLSMPTQEPKPGAVQLLTMHSSKGLEWDAVFLPGMTQNNFPGNQTDLWTRETRGDLPYPLRGDRATLPSWEQDRAGTVQEWAGLSGVGTWGVKMQEEHGPNVLPLNEQVKLHELSEARRLAYVAFTRAKQLLWVAGAHWQGLNKKPQVISEFFTEMLEYNSTHGLDQKGLWVEEFPEENPRGEKAFVAQWPYDPLEGPIHYQVTARNDGRLSTPDESSVVVRRSHGRRAALEKAAEQVRSAQPDPELLDAELKQRVDWVLDRAHVPSIQEIYLPEHLSTSRFVELAEDPEAVARQIRRPMPQRPTAAAREGTLVHEWIEQFYIKNMPGLTPTLDIDDTTDHQDAQWDETTGLAQLRQQFEATQWATRTPVQIEAAVETSVAGLTLRGRIDAVFRSGGDPDLEYDPNATWELVDWKTGRVPPKHQMAQRSLQLAIYRLAWSRLHDIPLEQITGKFVYLAHGIEIAPQDFASEKELEQILTSALS